MTIGDNVETIPEEGDLNEGRLSLAERLCDQQLDIPDENGPEGYRYIPSIELAIKRILLQFFEEAIFVLPMQFVINQFGI